MADVADRAAVTRAITELEEEQGRPCDVLITSAGLARPGHFLDLPDEVFRQMMEVDYFGTLYALRAVAPGMVERGRGSLVAVSSAAGLVGIFGYSAYGPAKFAVRGPRNSPRRTGGSRRRPAWSAARSSRSRRRRSRRPSWRASSGVAS
ncbi:short chain dehydrogenase [Streptomyces sp. NL15-2K]|nr:short chain dehydrogenase [Streptomyces sp. NL15-2K]